jgi:hypothetical protein
MPSFPLPAAALDDRLAFVGTSGSGKTYAAGTAVETLLHAKARVVIVDPLDVWWGLRLQADGKTAAWPVIIFGGAHGDLPITEQSGAVVGETVATVADSCIVSLGGFHTKASERRFMLAFLERLYRAAPGEPFHLIFDEADLWAPQRTSEPKLQSLMENIVRRGRIKGTIPWLITQRPAVLSKDVLSQADGLIAMKLTSSQDRDAIGAWIEGQADKAEAKRTLARLPRMERGCGIAWLPGHDVLTEVRFPTKASFDSSRTPKRGETVRAATLKPIDIAKVQSRLAAIEQAATSPKGRPASTGSSSASTSSAAMTTAPSAAALQAAEDRGVERGRRAGWEDGRATHYADGYRQALKDVSAAVASVTAPVGAPIALPPPKAKVVPPAPAARPAAAPSATRADLPAGERKVLIAIAQHAQGVRRDQLAVLTGYKRRTRNDYLLRLQQRGCIENTGDRVVATPAGIAALGDSYDPLPTGEALRLRVLGELPEGERRILEVLIANHPGGVARGELDGATGYARRTRNDYLARLKSRMLIATSGDEVRASDDLFDRAA